MTIRIAAALALIAATSLHAQTAPTATQPVDYATAVPLEGNWNYATVPAGSEATFVNSAGVPQLTLTCSRATRQVTVSKPASAAAPSLSVWTSSQTRNLAASYNPATGKISAIVSAYDPLLDAMAFSRGRIAVSVAGQAALVVPDWAELGRVVEDCRA